MDSLHRSSSSSATERLSAFRHLGDEVSTRKRAFSRKTEVFVGVSVTLVGLLLLVTVLLRPSKEEAVVGQLPVASSNVVVPSTELLDGEVMVALPVQVGHYPSQLAVGDTVRIVVTPGINGDGETRLLTEEVVVTELSKANDVGAESVITVRAPQSIFVDIAASGPIHVAKVNGTPQ